MSLYLGKDLFTQKMSLVSGGGSSGDTIEYANLTNKPIEKNDKLWINTTATTTTVAEAQISTTSSYTFIQTPNPNIIVGQNKVFTLTDNKYVQSSGSAPSYSIHVHTDKFGNILDNEGKIYNFINGTYKTISHDYMGNGYFHYSSTTLQKYNTTTWELEKTYTGSGSQLLRGWSFEDNYIISASAYYGYLKKVKLDDSNDTFTVGDFNNVSITPIGQFTERNIAFGLAGNASYSLNLIAYKYSRNGDTLDDINFTSIPSSEFPDDMQPLFTEAPATIYWDEYSKIICGIWNNPTKILIFKFENGEWKNLTPAINIDYSSSAAANLHVSTSSDLSKILISSNATGKYATIYDGNKLASGYYAVPYLYSRKESFTAKANNSVDIDSKGTASTVLVNA